MWKGNNETDVSVCERWLLFYAGQLSFVFNDMHWPCSYEWSCVCEFIEFVSGGGDFSSSTVWSALTFNKDVGAWTAFTRRLAATAHGLHDGHCETVNLGMAYRSKLGFLLFLPMLLSLREVSPLMDLLKLGHKGVGHKGLIHTEYQKLTGCNSVRLQPCCSPSCYYSTCVLVT